MSAPDTHDEIRREVMVTPYDDRRGPGVLVVHSGRGLTGYIEQICGRLAHHGFVGYAIDLFDGTRPETVAEANDCKSNLDESEALSDLENAVEFLSGHRKVSRDFVGVLGIGFGGELALKLAESAPANIGALVVYYGYADIDWGGLEMPFLGHYAEIDPDIPQSTLRDARQRLLANGRYCEFKLYESAEPSFFEDEPTARFHPSKARTSWTITQEFLRRALLDEMH